jgi:hypothetical protein
VVLGFVKEGDGREYIPEDLHGSILDGITNEPYRPGGGTIMY